MFIYVLYITFFPDNLACSLLWLRSFVTIWLVHFYGKLAHATEAFLISIFRYPFDPTSIMGL